MKCKKKQIKFIILLLLIAGAVSITIFQLLNEKKEIISDSITARQALRGIALAGYDQAVTDTDEYLNTLKTDGIIDNIPQTNTSFTYKMARDIVKKLNISSDEIDKLLNHEGTMEGADWNRVFEYIYVSSPNKKHFAAQNLVTVGYSDSDIICKSGKYKYIYNRSKTFYNTYADKSVKAMTYDNEIIYIYGQSSDDIVYENVWIKKANKNNISVYMYGLDRKFNSAVDDNIQNSIADITVRDGELIRISLKKDTISGKVLAVDKNSVEVEGFGRIPLSKEFKVYKDYGGLQLKNYRDILVGYNVQDFVVAKGEICAAVIHSDIEAKSIRVLLKTDNFEDIYHQNVIITCDSDFVIRYGDDNKSRKYKAGASLQISHDSKYLANGRVVVEAADKKSKLCVSSLNRGYGHPYYRGTLELACDEHGIILINELSMEEYLYAVVPSEMPVSYGATALEVQAVCARTYAYRQVLDNSYSRYGAHVDDSVSFQVYNNAMETEESINAVKSTYGRIITYKNEAIQAFFFSTSCGATTESDIWGSDNLPYIRSRYLADGKSMDLANEKTFDKFIRKKYKTYDSDYDYYRWAVSMSQEEISTSVNRQLPAIPGVKLQNVGSVTDIKPVKRGKGGVLRCIQIIGTDGEVEVELQGNIRKLFDISGHTLTMNNGKTTNGFSMFPSACFVIDKNYDAQGNIIYTFVGGGFGHGVGMSQNATKSMADAGMSWEEIVEFFYKDIEIKNAYSL